MLAAKRDACRVPEDRQVSIHNKIKRLLADKNKAFDKAKKAYEAMHEAESTLDVASSDHRKAEAKIADLQRESDVIRDAQRAAAEATPAPEDIAAGPCPLVGCGGNGVGVAGAVGAVVVGAGCWRLCCSWWCCCCRCFCCFRRCCFGCCCFG